MPRMNNERAYEEAKDRALLGSLSVSALVKIISYDAENHAVDVSPLVYREFSGAYKPLPPILSVPVCFPVGAGYRIEPAYQTGDIGIVVFLDQDSDNVLATGDGGEPNSERIHSTDDAVFLGTILHRETAERPVMISTPDGRTKIELSEAGIVIRGNVTVDGSITATGRITGGA